VDLSGILPVKLAHEEKRKEAAARKNIKLISFISYLRIIVSVDGTLKLEIGNLAFMLLYC
jgi:hypothetical protein